MINNELRHRIPVAFRTTPNGGIKRRAFSANSRAEAEHSLFLWAQECGVEIEEILSR